MLLARAGEVIEYPAFWCIHCCTRSRPLLCRCYEADEARLNPPSLSFVQTLQSKEPTKWTIHPPLRFLRTLFTARWN
jgi:hypothetical protein